MERGGEGSVALVMTVRDEVEFLRPNLLYHRFLGVGTAYVYDDGSTDGTAESVADLPFVRVAPSVDPRRSARTMPTAPPPATSPRGRT
jgi:hypothetical protein